MQSENKLCVVLLFGGMSSEHEVSRVSVGNFVNNIDRTKYEVLAVGITKEGRWLYTEATAAQMADGSWEELAGNMPCILSPDRADHGMVLFTPEGHVEKLHVDVVIPVLHGLWGEDGTVQGLLELPTPCLKPTTSRTPSGWPPTAGRSRVTWRVCALVWRQSWAGPCSSSPPTPVPAWVFLRCPTVRN